MIQQNGGLATDYPNSAIIVQDLNDFLLQKNKIIQGNLVLRQKNSLSISYAKQYEVISSVHIGCTTSLDRLRIQKFSFSFLTVESNTQLPVRTKSNQQKLLITRMISHQEGWLPLGKISIERNGSINIEVDMLHEHHLNIETRDQLHIEIVENLPKIRKILFLDDGLIYNVLSLNNYIDRKPSFFDSMKIERLLILADKFPNTDALSLLKQTSKPCWKDHVEYALSQPFNSKDQQFLLVNQARIQSFFRPLQLSTTTNIQKMNNDDNSLREFKWPKMQQSLFILSRIPKNKIVHLLISECWKTPAASKLLNNPTYFHQINLQILSGLNEQHPSPSSFKTNLPQKLSILHQLLHLLNHLHENGLILFNLTPNKFILYSYLNQKKQKQRVLILHDSTDIKPINTKANREQFDGFGEVPPDDCYSERMDVFGFGVLAYKIILGRSPLAGRWRRGGIDSSPEEIIEKRICVMPEAFSSVVYREIGQNMAKIIVNCLHYNPQKRCGIKWLIPQWGELIDNLHKTYRL